MCLQIDLLTWGQGDTSPAEGGYSVIVKQTLHVVAKDSGSFFSCVGQCCSSKHCSGWTLLRM